MKKSLAGLLALLISVPLHAAGMQLEVIPLQSRTVDEIVPIVRPLLPEGASVTGMDNQLVIKSTPESIAEIRQLLANIDRPLRRLMITVSQDLAGTRSGTELGLSGRVREGDVTVENRDGDGRRGATVTAGSEDGDHVRLRALDRREEIDDRNSYRVQAVEGQAAFIQSGVSVPIPQRNVTVVPGTVVVQDTTEYYDANSGFYVLPRLSGDNVTLFISPYMTRPQAGRLPAFDVQQAETTLSGRLGQWIPLGGIEQESHRSGRGILSSSDRHSTESRTIFIKVDEIR